MAEPCFNFDANLYISGHLQPPCRNSCLHPLQTIVGQVATVLNTSSGSPQTETLRSFSPSANFCTAFIATLRGKIWRLSQQSTVSGLCRKDICILYSVGRYSAKSNNETSIPVEVYPLSGYVTLLDLVLISMGLTERKYIYPGMNSSYHPKSSLD